MLFIYYISFYVSFYLIQATLKLDIITFVL